MSKTESEKKKVVLFVGEMSAADKDRFAKEAREQGAEAVEFIESPLPKSDSDQRVQKAQECAEKVCDVFKRWVPTLHEHFGKNISAIPWKNEPPYKIKVIHHLCDRILYVPLHTTMLHEENPMFSYIDSASLNRSLFETIVNCLYILNDKSNEALAGIISKSVDEDVKLRNELLKWTSNPNPGISEGAKLQAADITTQISDKGKILQGLPQTPRLFPNIRERCRSLSDIWQFLYASRYQQMCAWSHIHLEHVLFSPSQTLSSPQDLANAVSKGTEMVYLSFHFVYLFLLSLSEGNQPAQDELTATYQDLLNKLNPILKDSGDLTPATGTK